MPIETSNAINWALTQTINIEGEEYPITKDTPIFLVDKVREYFNLNSITYSTFSYNDLIPFI